MKITNIGNLPAPLVAAVMNDDYSRGDADWSVSDLINPVQLTTLKKRYWSEITEDASDRIWSLAGRAVHKILEMAKEKHTLQEERLFATVLGRKISGSFDRYDDGVLQDWKFVGAWSGRFESRLWEWTKQLNSYAWLLREHGFPVTRLEIVAIYRDWKKTDALRSADYPQRKAEVIPIPLYAHEEAGQFLKERVQALIDAEDVPDDNLPNCSAEEMWLREIKWALKKKKNKRATKNYETEMEAKKALAEQAKPEEFEVVEKPGARLRCESYCSASLFCSQHVTFKSLQEDADASV